MDSAVGSEDEVKKLQDLVKKLEKQNELLRSKADGIGSSDHELSPSKNKLDTHHTPTKLLKQTDSGSTNNLLESVKLLDLNILEDDEDTWLYTSPIRQPTPEQKVVDPKAWVRQDFENPEPDEKMKTAKRALLAKLDEVSRANRNSMGPNAFVAPSQVPALSQQVASAASTAASQSATSPRPASPPIASAGLPLSSSSSIANHSSPSHSPQHSPSHSKSSSASSSLNNMVDASLGVGKLDSSPVSSPPNTPSRKERKSSEERLSFSRLEDVTDVQILAKMQEESLRQATQQSPANSPRRMVSAGSDQALHRAVSRTSSQSSMCSDKDDIDAEMSSPRQSNTGVVRRRPSLERLRKNTDTGKDVRRYSYGAKYPSNHVNDNGDAITLAELQKLAQEKKAKRHTSSLPNLNKTSPVQANSKPKNILASEGRKSRGLKQPNNLPRKRSTASNSSAAVNKKIEKAKGHGGSLPNLNRNNYNGQQQQQPNNSNSHQSAPTTTEPSEPKVKQPNTVPVKRSPTSTPNSKSGLRQPSPTKLRASSPSRSGIPVRLSMNERSAIPRPRSAILSPRGHMMQASTLPRASAQNSMNRTVTRSKDDSWREGCY